MIHFGKLELGEIPRVVLAQGDYSADAASAAAEGVAILEMRIDLFSSADPAFVKSQLQRYQALGLPLLGTIRLASELGKWSASEDSRKSLFMECLPWLDGLDIELNASAINQDLAKTCKAAGKTLIVSNHSAENTPPDAELEKRFAAAKALGADIVKLACLAQSQEDQARLMALVARHRHEGIIGISMGALGSASRALAPLLGSLLTYSSRDLAHGQWELKELVQTLRRLSPAFEAEMRRKTL